jgi:hypothetical protein
VQPGGLHAVVASSLPSRWRGQVQRRVNVGRHHRWRVTARMRKAVRRNSFKVRAHRAMVVRVVVESKGGSALRSRALRLAPL